MVHPKQHIADLAEIGRAKGLINVVISPGSRNAPLISAFYTVFGNQCISIVDERSAAYYALGIALSTQRPVALICTSGTAVLNYAPALAEAYYQRVPLLAITADRPGELIDQQSNQTLRQKNIYRNFIKKSYELPKVITCWDDLWFAHRMVNEAFNVCLEPDKGPVHINVPLTEPLYDELPPASGIIKLIHHEYPEIAVKLPDELITCWKKARRIMIIHGQDVPDSGVSEQLACFKADRRIIILAENISNVKGNHIISNSNLVLSNTRDHNPEYPDLIIHSGGQVVSKALAGYVRRASTPECWRVGSEPGIIDTFQKVTRHISFPAGLVYAALAETEPVHTRYDYRKSWTDLVANYTKEAVRVLDQLPFSDAHVFCYLSDHVPPNAVLVTGNSSAIRYSQLFPATIHVDHYANRGVSGIDGSLSTAAGIAYALNTLTIAVTGDLGFLYDSNALWNNSLSANLRVVVINNQGGGIFHMLKGASEQPGFKKFVEAHHPVNIHKLAEAYGLNYLFADDADSLAAVWMKFIDDQKNPVVLEIKTDPVTSTSTFRKLMNMT